jgi:hypothetical protein
VRLVSLKITGQCDPPALIADWSIAYGLASLAMTAGLFGRPGQATAVLVIWLVLDAVAVRLFPVQPFHPAWQMNVCSALLCSNRRRCPCWPWC